MVVDLLPVLHNNRLTVALIDSIASMMQYTTRLPIAAPD